MLKVNKSAWRAINRVVLRSDGKVLKGTEKALNDNEKALKGNEVAY